MTDARNLDLMRLPDSPRLADMTDNRIVGDRSFDRRISVGDDYDTSRHWAESLQLAGFDGVYYEARHHIGGISLALFGDPAYQPYRVTLLDDDVIIPTLLERARNACGLRVEPSSPLL